jgi:prepilin-type N-terminal cleavage/methylation domain-containing protein
MPAMTRSMDAGVTKHCRGGRRSIACRALRGRVLARLKGDGGFTVVELVVAMVIVGIVSAAVLAIFGGLTGVFHSQQVRMQNQDYARTAINQMTRYLRMATSSADNMTTQSNAIERAASDDIEFYCDLDGDGLAEKVRYYLSDTTLLMQTADPTTIAASPYYSYPEYQTDGVVVGQAIRNGTEALFTYYYGDDDGGLAVFEPENASERQEIVTVGISLIVNATPELAAGNVQLAAEVQLRQRYEGGLTEE